MYLVLIPEIALNYQTLLRFLKRFGTGCPVMKNSRYLAGEIRSVQRAKKGELD